MDVNMTQTNAFLEVFIPMLWGTSVSTITHMVLLQDWGYDANDNALEEQNLYGVNFKNIQDYIIEKGIAARMKSLDESTYEAQFAIDSDKVITAVALILDGNLAIDSYQDGYKSYTAPTGEEKVGFIAVVPRTAKASWEDVVTVKVRMDTIQ